jgi:uncharacterized protein YuzE
MYPEITYDKENGLAYIAFSNKEINKSIAVKNDLFVMDLDQKDNLVGIEILSVTRLRKEFVQFSASKENSFSQDMLPAYIIPFITSSQPMPTKRLA